MTLIEATGGPLACSRCGSPLPDEGPATSGWGSQFMNGRLVLLSCPQCLTAEERAEVGEHDGAELTEVAGARGATVDQLAGLGAPRPWLVGLAPDGRHVGVLTGEERDGHAECVFAGEGEDGKRRAVVLEVDPAAWMQLEEMFVPYWVQSWARRFAAGLAGRHHLWD